VNQSLRPFTRFVNVIRALIVSKTFPILLAEAAIVWSVFLRVFFFRSFPDPFPTPDTWSYLSGAYGLLEKGQFDLFAMRTPGFPLLVWLVLATSRSFAVLTVVHGVLTLLSAVAIGYVVRAFGGPWRWPAALAVSFVALNPHLLYWEHFVMTEGSFQAFFVFTLGAIALTLLRPTAAWAGIAGFLSAVAVLIRPQGQFLIPLMLISLAWAIRRLGRRRFLTILGAAIAGPVILLGGWSARNARVHYFFGLSNVTPLVNLGITARWIDLDSPLLAEDKALIADSIRRYRSMPDNVNWVQYSAEGPATILNRKYGSDERRRDEVYNTLAREAALKHPGAVIGRGLATIRKLLTDAVHHPEGFQRTALWDRNWVDIAKKLPVDQHRAALNETRFPLDERERVFDEDIAPLLEWEDFFIRISFVTTLFALFALPLLSGPRRIATALAAFSVILVIFTAGFFSESAERYLSVIHGAAALAGALALTGVIERFFPVRKTKPRTLTVPPE
jgi:hypothetical protein